MDYACAESGQLECGFLRLRYSDQTLAWRSKAVSQRDLLIIATLKYLCERRQRTLLLGGDMTLSAIEEYGSYASRSLLQLIASGSGSRVYDRIKLRTEVNLSFERQTVDRSLGFVLGRESSSVINKSAVLGVETAAALPTIRVSLFLSGKDWSRIVFSGIGLLALMIAFEAGLPVNLRYTISLQVDTVDGLFCLNSLPEGHQVSSRLGVTTALGRDERSN